MVPKFVHEYSTQKHFVFSVFLFFILVYYLFKHISKPLELKYSSAHIFLLLFGISGFLSLISVSIENKYYLSTSVGTAFYLALIILFSYLVTSRFGENFKFIEIGLFMFMITGTIIAFDGLLNKFLGFDLFFGKYGDPSQRITLRTTIGNPNFVSDYLAQLLPISIYFTLRKDTKFYTRIFSLINVFIMLWVILLAQTRSIYLSTVIGLAFSAISFFMTKKKDSLKSYIKTKQFKIWTLLVLGVILFLFVMFNFETPFNKGGEVIATERFSALTSVSSWDERMLSWLSAVKQFNDKNHRNHFFIGSGINTYSVYSLHYLAQVQNENPERFLYAWNNFKRAHNDYLQVLGETGLFGFLSIIMMILSLVFIYFKVLKHEQDNDNKNLLFPLFGWSAVVMIIHAFTEFAFHLQPNITLSVFILSVAVSKQFNPKIKSLKIKKGYVFIILMLVVAFVSCYFKFNESLSEAYYVIANSHYSAMLSFKDAYDNQLPNIISQLQSQKNALQDQLLNYSFNSQEFKNITQNIAKIESEINKYQELKLKYEDSIAISYEQSFNYFLKSLNSNNNFGKSAFYMAQLFSSDVRLNHLKYEDLPKVFNLELNEYQFMISRFNGALDLMPFPDNILRDTVEPVYTTTKLDNNSKILILRIQSLYDSINQLEYAYTSFNEKNAYRLIGRMYYNIVVLYEQLKENIPLESQIQSNIEKLQLEAYNNFHYWMQKAIYILPGGWNRFPEWENIYSEYILLTGRCLEIYPENEITGKIIDITKKDGLANYYMAKKSRGIPDNSLTVLSEVYLALKDRDNKLKLANAVVDNYQNVYQYYKQLKNENSQGYLQYQKRIDSFLNEYEFFERRSGTL
jgi:O-antigen ligase